jgi:hypothetical protein
MRIGPAGDEAMQLDGGASDIFADVRERGDRGQDIQAWALGAWRHSPHQQDD